MEIISMTYVILISKIFKNKPYFLYNFLVNFSTVKP